MEHEIRAQNPPYFFDKPRAYNMTGFAKRSSEKVAAKAPRAKCPDATLHSVVEDI
jgi:hypothetical protein